MEDFSCKEPQIGKAGGPKQAANHVEQDECFIVHFAGAGDNWRESTNNRHKASEDD